MEFSRPGSSASTSSDALWAAVDDFTPKQIIEASVGASVGKNGDDSEPSSRKRKASPSIISPRPAKEAKASYSAIVVAAMCRSGPLQDIIGTMPWGTQWELSRALYSLKREYSSLEMDFLQELAILDTENGVKAIENLLPIERSSPSFSFDDQYANEHAASRPWRELDRELSFNNSSPRTYLRSPDSAWHGGSVWFSARVRGNSKIGYSQALDLLPPMLGPSTRFTRRFGSHSFVRVKLDQPRPEQGEDLIKFFRTPFIISGRVFRAFYAKENTVHLFKTNEAVVVDEDGIPCISTELLEGMSLLEFIQWHNHPDFNSAQTVVKWAARFALGTSSSVPGICLSPENIHFIEDIISPDYVGTHEKTPTELIMTDGCGLVNLALLNALQSQFGWPNRPIAIQVRINGAKGLLTLHPNHATASSDTDPHVWIRTSQRKIQYCPSASPDPALYTVDVLRASHMSTASFSAETIINLAENGVPPQVFLTLLKTALEGRVNALTQPRDQFSLFAALAHEGGVIAGRLARWNPGTARVHGHVYEDNSAYSENPDEDADEDLVSHPFKLQSSAWWEDPISGCPSSLEETAMVLIASGFTVEDCPVLCNKMLEIVKKSIKTITGKFRIFEPQSCSAFVIPDPTGTLQAGEVHIKSSSRNLVDMNGEYTDLIVGPVLLTRHPCKVPSDVQQAVAVFKYELRQYVDVIVVSTKGHVVNGEFLKRHLASLTGGGDYDGDRMEAFWRTSVTDTFISADPHKFAIEPPRIKADLEADKTTVLEFITQTNSLPEHEQVTRYQHYLLGVLRNGTQVGTYSGFWEKAMYRYGYDHNETVRLAYMFCAVLDGVKTGATVRRTVYREDDKLYSQYRSPEWKKSIQPRSNLSSTDNARFCGRLAHLPEFIMDTIARELKQERAAQLKVAEKRLQPPANAMDPHLVTPWNDFLVEVVRPGAPAFLARCQRDIMSHVRELREEWTRTLAPKAASGKGFGDLPIEKRQDKLRRLSEKFQLAVNDVHATYRLFDIYFYRRIMASYAYRYNAEVAPNSHHFPWDIATRTLCDIKANAVSNGRTRTILEDFFNRLMVHKKFLPTSQPGSRY